MASSTSNIQTTPTNSAETTALNDQHYWRNTTAGDRSRAENHVKEVISAFLAENTAKGVADIVLKGDALRIFLRDYRPYDGQEHQNQTPELVMGLTAEFVIRSARESAYSSETLTAEEEPVLPSEALASIRAIFKYSEYNAQLWAEVFQEHLGPMPLKSVTVDYPLPDIARPTETGSQRAYTNRNGPQPGHADPTAATDVNGAMHDDLISDSLKVQDDLCNLFGAPDGKHGVNLKVTVGESRILIGEVYKPARCVCHASAPITLL